MTDDQAELMEKLAAIEHQRWAQWQDWMQNIAGIRNADGSITLPADCVARWDRQITTSYADLTEREKESDREQVRRYWDLICP